MAVHLQGDVWICMELMDTSLDKFYRKVLDKGMTIPEDILGEIAVSVSGVGGVPVVVFWAELGPPCGLQLWPCSWAAALGSPRCPHPGPEPAQETPGPWSHTDLAEPGSLGLPVQFLSFEATEED